MIPTISIILPTFNRTKFLRLAIESIYAQTYADWEVIVADDGSGDETKAYLRGIADPRIHVFYLQHSGNPAAVRNHAVAKSRCRYLAFLDSDDLWAPSKLERQMQLLLANPHCRWSYTACDRIDAEGASVQNERLRSLVLRDGWIFEPLLKLEVSIAMPTVVVEREFLLATGGFDEHQRFGEFHDLCLRLSMNSEVIAAREPLCSVRAHDQHYSADRLAAHADWMRLYEKMARLTGEPALRAHCTRMRAERSVTLSRVLGSRGEFRAVCRTLGNASKFSWRYPRWWYGAARSIVHAVVASSSRSLRGSAPV